MLSSQVAARIGRNLAAARAASGLSQEEVAFRASLHRTEIGLLERGERLPRIDTVIRVAGALGISIEVVVDGIEWVPGVVGRGGFAETDFLG